MCLASWLLNLTVARSIIYSVALLWEIAYVCLFDVQIAHVNYEKYDQIVRVEQYVLSAINLKSRTICTDSINEFQNVLYVLLSMITWIQTFTEYSFNKDR